MPSEHPQLLWVIDGRYPSIGRILVDTVRRVAVAEVEEEDEGWSWRVWDGDVGDECPRWARVVTEQAARQVAELVYLMRLEVPHE